MTPESTEPRTAALDAAWKIIIAFLDDLDYNPPSLCNDAADLVRRLEAIGLTIAPTEPGRVVIDWNTIECALLDIDYANMTAYEITHRIMQAIDDAVAKRAATTPGRVEIELDTLREWREAAESLASNCGDGWSFARAIDRIITAAERAASGGA